MFVHKTTIDKNSSSTKVNQCTYKDSYYSTSGFQRDKKVKENSVDIKSINHGIEKRPLFPLGMLREGYRACRV